MSISGIPMDTRARGASIAICLGLIALTWIVFGQTIHHQFVNYDDNTYVYENGEVAAGISLQGIAWAFTHVYSSNWHPLTTISHMLDCQLYRLNAGGHHFTNILLHTTVAVLLFLALREMTGAVWRSAFVAAIFAIHPLRVESVAWIAERKDILSGLFFVLTLIAYVRYSRRLSWPRYSLVGALFAMGLLCKPMLVTMPFVLLLVDYWPLRRFEQTSARRLFIEKIPLLVLSAASCVATLIAQKDALSPLTALPLSWRVSNAFLACVTYIAQMFWPRHLALFYPDSEDLGSFWRIALAVLVIGAVTAAGLICRRKRPYLFTGWFWYLGMLVPVIGIVQVGLQAHADRYTYLPHIGLYILLTWSVAEAALAHPYYRRVLRVAAAVIIIALASLAWIQTTYWRDSERLWKHALNVTRDNDIAHDGLGTVYLGRGQVKEAISEFRAALRLQPNSEYYHHNLGLALLQGGRLDEAIEHLETALKIFPEHRTVHYNLGNAYLQKGKIDAAISQYKEQLASQPGHTRARCSLAAALLQSGDVDQAITQYEKAIELQPDYAEAHYNLGNCYLKKGETDQAIKQYRETLKLAPNFSLARNNLAIVFWQVGQKREAVEQWEQGLRGQGNSPQALANLGWVLATSGDMSIRSGPHALELAQRAHQLAENDPKILRVLAAAYAATGKFQEAIDVAQNGLELANHEGDTVLAESFQADLANYRSNTPLRE